jgi:hypothetical protein
LIDISKFKRKLQAGLKGLNYVGIIEPRLYLNVGPGTVWTNKKATIGTPSVGEKTGGRPRSGFAG